MRGNKDDRDDLVEITPRGSVGFNMMPLLSTGSAYRYGGLWYDDTQASLQTTVFL